MRDPKRIEIRNAILLSALLLAFAAWALLFMDRPHDIRPSIWLGVRLAFVALNAANLAWHLCRWRAYIR